MTISEWIEYMQEPYKTQAKNNLSFEDVEDYQHMSDAVRLAFSWYDTPEGSEYWYLYYKTLKIMGL